MDSPGTSGIRPSAAEVRDSVITKPLIFISHDTRDAELAKAFSRLIRTVTANMLDTFRSSDKEGHEGIEYGDDWFKRIMEQLENACDVVCLFTQRSLDRPWILFEAGVAKGKFNTAVYGLALGVSLTEVGKSGPFYQFQNVGDDEASLVKLVNQLARKIPGCEPDDAVVKQQVSVFKEAVAAELATLSDGKEAKAEDAGAAARVLEEFKSLVRDLPMIMERSMAEISVTRPRMMGRKFHPMMLEELFMMRKSENSLLPFLIMISTVKDEVPWLFEIGMEVYRAARASDSDALVMSMRTLEEALMLTRSEKMMRNWISSRDTEFILHEMGHMISMFMETMLPREESPKAENLSKERTRRLPSKAATDK